MWNKNILKEIFEYLESRDIAAFRGVCKDWLDLCQDNKIWKEVVEREFPQVVVLEDASWKGVKNAHLWRKGYEQNAFTVGVVGKDSLGMVDKLSKFILGKDFVSFAFVSPPSLEKACFLFPEVHCWLWLTDSAEPGWELKVSKKLESLNNSVTPHSLVVVGGDPCDSSLHALQHKHFKFVILKDSSLKSIQDTTNSILSVIQETGVSARNKFFDSIQFQNTQSKSTNSKKSCSLL